MAEAKENINHEGGQSPSGSKLKKVVNHWESKAEGGEKKKKG